MIQNRKLIPKKVLGEKVLNLLVKPTKKPVKPTKKPVVKPTKEILAPNKTKKS